MATVVVMWEMPTFECGDLFAALDARRDEDGLGWYEIADELFMLRWLDRAPEDFLTGAVVDVGDLLLPEAGPDRRLRWDLSQLHEELNDQRQQQGLTWAELADGLGCTPSRLTNLRTAGLADMDLVMRITQWLRQPAAAFIHPAQW